jgi:Zn-dependent peptidase ImmA (M78 family)
MSQPRFNEDPASFFAKKLLMESDAKYNSLPIDVRGIARSHNVTIEEEDADHFEGYSVKIEGNVGILVNSRYTYEKRKRFTIAHELGHIFIPYHKGVKYICAPDDMIKSGLKGDEEAEANEFAAELLMPEDILREECKDLNVDMASIDVVSDKYNVSKTAAMLRFVEFTYGICAAIFVKDGQIKSFKSSESFNEDHLFVAVNEKVSPVSTVNGYFTRQIPLSDKPVQVQAKCWISEKFKKQPYCINEYAFEIDPGRSVVVFIWTGDDYQRYVDDNAY